MCGNKNWSIKDGTTLTITGEVGNYDPNRNPAPWGQDITEVIVGSGVTAVGDFAFYGCKKLVRVTLPKSVTRIGDGAFNGCESLRELQIPEGVTEIGVAAFEGCKSLRGIQIPEGIEKLEFETFRGCKALKEVGFPQSLTEIGHAAFCGCAQLRDVTFPEGLVEVGSWAFAGCESLTAVTVPASVGIFGEGAVEGCSLDQITFLGSKTKIKNPFRMRDAKNVNFPGTVEQWSRATEGAMGRDLDFEWLSLLKTPYGRPIRAREGSSWTLDVDGLLVVNGAEMANSRYFPRYYVKRAILRPSVKTISDKMFEGFSNLVAVEIQGRVTHIGNAAFAGCSSLADVTIPDSVASIGDEAFAGCSSLTEVTIPQNITRIGDEAFGDCQALTAIWVAQKNRWFFDRDGVLFERSHSQGISLVQYPCGKAVKRYAVPRNVTSIKRHAFRGAVVEQVRISSKVKKIFLESFLNSAIKTVSYAGTARQFDRLWNCYECGCSGCICDTCPLGDVHLAPSSPRKKN